MELPDQLLKRKPVFGGELKRIRPPHGEKVASVGKFESEAASQHLQRIGRVRFDMPLNVRRHQEKRMFPIVNRKSPRVANQQRSPPLSGHHQHQKLRTHPLLAPRGIERHDVAIAKIDCDAV
ncbi:hypothetical protein SDC9_141861 [bioreactor metagenome]|uniref:Uncharacterized protein n=1 Tax=bioreactor metagenome TaxID=1076179 RepID=A0A645E1K4_9ZZZZ